MIASVFTIYFLAMIAMLIRKKKLAYTLIGIGFLFALFIFKFHATDVLNIRL